VHHAGRHLCVARRRPGRRRAGRARGGVRGRLEGAGIGVGHPRAGVGIHCTSGFGPASAARVVESRARDPPFVCCQLRGPRLFVIISGVLF
jgi:hypothetical protein